MFRIVAYLLLIALLALGATWIAEQGGHLVLTIGSWRIQTTLPVAALLAGILVALVLTGWSLLRGVWRAPRKARLRLQAKRQNRARDAIAQGLIAIGHGDAVSARTHSNVARKLAANDPLALLLQAQAAQLDGDREGAAQAFHQMAQRKDTRLLGLRGLFIEAQRADDPHAAVRIAEEALATSSGVPWASQAILGLRCAQGDWSGALAILERDMKTGVTDRRTYRRHRAVLLTARALDLEMTDRDVSRESVFEAVKLAPTLVPAAVLAAKFQSEANQIRKAMRIIEAAWIAHPHPDLADAYSHVKIGDFATARLVRVETLAAKAPDHLESRIAVARAAIDAQEFARARAVLAPLLSAPTQRVAMLMAEIERAENGDTGRARSWMQRAVRALHDPVWTADGYISDRWRPVSPVTGRLDAFQWHSPLAALPGDRVVDAASDDQPPQQLSPSLSAVESAETSPESEAGSHAADAAAPGEDETPGSSAPLAVEEAAAASPAPPAPPLFRARKDLAQPASQKISPMIPVVRPPDDPGIDEDEAVGPDELTDAMGSSQRQQGGWRGFLHRWGL